ncbi:MAG: methylmalonyl-CoA epimerase [Bacteroidetes bacterium]|nr:MAG: methylmalonyl-CoA epimerase [Bacteroidota bacterium]
MNRIEHIGIAVGDLESAMQTFERLLGTPPYKKETVESEGVKTVFFKVGEIKIELLEATKADSPIAKFIDKRGQGIHHIAFDVDSVEEKAAELRANDFVVLNESPKAGADNKMISFIHPKSTNGVLVELCQEKDK